MSCEFMKVKSRIIKSFQNCESFDEIESQIQDWYSSIPYMEEFK